MTDPKELRRKAAEAAFKKAQERGLTAVPADAANQQHVKEIAGPPEPESAIEEMISSGVETVAGLVHLGKGAFDILNDPNPLTRVLKLKNAAVTFGKGMYYGMQNDPAFLMSLIAPGAPESALSREALAAERAASAERVAATQAAEAKALQSVRRVSNNPEAMAQATQDLERLPTEPKNVSKYDSDMIDYSIRQIDSELPSVEDRPPRAIDNPEPAHGQIGDSPATMENFGNPAPYEDVDLTKWNELLGTTVDKGILPVEDAWALEALYPDLYAQGRGLAENFAAQVDEFGPKVVTLLEQGNEVEAAKIINNMRVDAQNAFDLGAIDEATLQQLNQQADALHSRLSFKVKNAQHVDGEPYDLTPEHVSPTTGEPLPIELDMREWQRWEKRTRDLMSGRDFNPELAAEQIAEKRRALNLALQTGRIGPDEAAVFSRRLNFMEQRVMSFVPLDPDPSIARSIEQATYIRNLKEATTRAHIRMLRGDYEGAIADLDRMDLALEQSLAQGGRLEPYTLPTSDTYIANKQGTIVERQMQQRAQMAGFHENGLEQLNEIRALRAEAEARLSASATEPSVEEITMSGLHPNDEALAGSAEGVRAVVTDNSGNEIPTLVERQADGRIKLLFDRPGLSPRVLTEEEFRNAAQAGHIRRLPADEVVQPPPERKFRKVEAPTNIEPKPTASDAGTMAIVTDKAGNPIYTHVQRLPDGRIRLIFGRDGLAPRIMTEEEFTNAAQAGHIRRMTPEEINRQPRQPIYEPTSSRSQQRQFRKVEAPEENIGTIPEDAFITPTETNTPLAEHFDKAAEFDIPGSDLYYSTLFDSPELQQSAAILKRKFIEFADQQGLTADQAVAAAAEYAGISDLERAVKLLDEPPVARAIVTKSAKAHDAYQLTFLSADGQPLGDIVLPSLEELDMFLENNVNVPIKRTR